MRARLAWALCCALSGGAALAADSAPCAHVDAQAWRDELRAAPDAADLPYLKQRGDLRALFFQDPNARSCGLSIQEANALGRFAMRESLRLQWLFVDDAKQMPKLLAQRRVDILAAGAEVADNGYFRRTRPWRKASHRLVGRSLQPDIESLESLRSRQVAARPQTPAWEVLEAMAGESMGMGLIEIPASSSERQVLQDTLIGKYDIAVVDSLVLDALLPKYPGLRTGLDVADLGLLAWTAHPQASALIDALNRFIGGEVLAQPADGALLDEIVPFSKNRPLRIITNAAWAHYYLDEGKQKGFEYEMLRHFAEAKGLQLEVALANSMDEMLRMLAERKGDLIAASIPEGYAKGLEGTLHSSIYQYAAPLLVGADWGMSLLDPGYLQGREISLPATSPWLDWMARFQGQGNEFALHRVQGMENADQALSMAASGQIALTVLGSHELQAAPPEALARLRAFPLAEPMGLVWVARARDRRLVQELDAWIEGNYRGETFNVLQERYFKVGQRSGLSAVDGLPLSPWDDLIVRQAEALGFDRYLITALIYQESQFNPKARSRANARGLMQLTKATSDFMRVRDPEDPEQSIRGGIGYLDYLRGRLEEGILLDERVWFSLAAYNAGIGRIRQARRLAAEMGLDDSRWFGNVEMAMLELAKPYRKGGQLLRHCRCGETVIYVRAIRTRYRNYLRYSHREARPEGTLERG